MTQNIKDGPLLPLTHVIGHDADGYGGRMSVKWMDNIRALKDGITLAPSRNPQLLSPDTTTVVVQAASADTSTYPLVTSFASNLYAYTAVGGRGTLGAGAYARNSVAGLGYGVARYEFVTTANTVEIELETGPDTDSQSFQIAVDRHWIGTTDSASGQPHPTLFTTTSGRFVRLTFSTPIHHVTVERRGAAGIAGVRSPGGHTINPGGDAYPRVLWVTDSYGTTFSGTTDGQINTFVPQAAYSLGWDQLLNAVGGSGYMTASPFDDPARLAGVSANDLCAIVNCGGINDMGAVLSNASVFQARCVSTWAAQRALSPDSLIIVCGPWSGTNNPINLGSSIVQVETALQAAFATWADPHSVYVKTAYPYATLPGSGLPIITGDGRTIVFTAPLVAATSATLASAWVGTTGTKSIRFSDGTVKSATLTNGSTSVSWTGAVTAASVAAAYTSNDGTSSWLIGPDGTHPYDWLAHRHLGVELHRRIKAAVLAL